MAASRASASVLGGWLAVAGSFGVVVITGLYAAATPLASVPLPAGTGFAEALAASRANIGLLKAAGNIGLVADMLLIGGGVLLALRDGQTALQKLFWLWLALSTLVFVLVDGIAGQVLPRLLPVLGEDIGAYALARGLFDMSFAYGVLIFGGGLLAAAAEAAWPRPARIVALLIGVLAVANYALHLLGLTQPLLIGISVGLAGLFGMYAGWRETRNA
jgi:hypothetical protein